MADQTVPDSVPAEAVEAAAEWFSRWMGASSVRKRDREYAREVLVRAAPILVAAGRAQAAADLREIGRRFEADADQLLADGDQAGADATKQTAMGYWWAANAIVPPHEVARRNAEARLAEEAP